MVSYENEAHSFRHLNSCTKYRTTTVLRLYQDNTITAASRKPDAIVYVLADGTRVHRSVPSNRAADTQTPAHVCLTGGSQTCQKTRPTPNGCKVKVKERWPQNNWNEAITDMRVTLYFSTAGFLPFVFSKIINLQD